MKPLIVTCSVRNLYPYTYWLNHLNKYDRLIIKGYEHLDALNKAKAFFLDGDYTHFIIVAEDVLVKQDDIDLLLDDVYKENYDIIAGYSNFDFYHDWSNISLRDLRGMLIYAAEQYNFIKLSDIFSGKYSGIIKVFFQGNSLVCINRYVFKKVSFRGYKQFYDNLLNKIRPYMLDLAWAIDCANQNIPQYVDTRIFIPHAGNTIHLRDYSNKDIYFIEGKQKIYKPIST
ncbi:MAG: hypothetical protein QXV17_10455 [Candidatus Micrarchaeaceae archaeon]